jgi:hypothetical protein
MVLIYILESRKCTKTCNGTSKHQDCQQQSVRSLSPLRELAQYHDASDSLVPPREEDSGWDHLRCSPQRDRRAGIYDRGYGYRRCVSCLSYARQVHIQRVFTRISILQHDINNFQMIDHETKRTVCLGNVRVWAKTEFSEYGRYKGRIMGYAVEHGTVGTVIHGIERDLEFYGLRSRYKGDDFSRDISDVRNVVVSVHKAKVRKRSGGVVCDRRCDVFV